MNLTRVTSTFGAGAVATIAAWSSWQHMVHVAQRVGERDEVAYVLPLSVDGLLVVAAAAMTDDKRAGRAPRWSAKVSFAVGVLATVAANVASAQPTTGARIVAAWPAVALLFVVELLSRAGRRAVVAEPVPAPKADPVPEPAEPVKIDRSTPAANRPSTAAAKVARIHATNPALSHAELAKWAGVSVSTVKRYRPKAEPVNGRTPDLIGAGR